MADSVAKYFPAPGPCPFAGFQTEGEPRHVDQVVEGNIAYISDPWGDHTENRKKCAIVYLADNNGISHNARMHCDQFSGAGYLTIAPNYIWKVRAEGDENPVKVEGMPATKPEQDADQIGRITAAVNYLRSRGCHSIGVAGYCLGGRHAVALISATASLFMAAFIAHPAIVRPLLGYPGTSDEQIAAGNQAILDFYSAIQQPLSVAFADADRNIPREARELAETALLASGQPYQITLYSHVGHGFSVRRAFTSQADEFAKKQSFIQAISWFEEFLEVERQVPKPLADGPYDT